MGIILGVFLGAIFFAGLPFAVVIMKIKKMLNKGRESDTDMAEAQLWAMFFGVIVWIALIVGGIWLFKK